MNRTYTTTTQIHHVEKVIVWCALNNPDFVADFFPEISRDLNKSLRYFAQHKNGFTIRPSYAIPYKTLHWENKAGLSIALARRDLPVEIESIEIHLHEKKNGVISVQLVVNYDIQFGPLFLLAKNAVKHLFDKKLVVLKHDIESEHIPVDCLNAVYN